MKRSLFLITFLMLNLIMGNAMAFETSEIVTGSSDGIYLTSNYVLLSTATIICEEGDNLLILGKLFCSGITDTTGLLEIDFLIFENDVLFIDQTLWRIIGVGSTLYTQPIVLNAFKSNITAGTKTYKLYGRKTSGSTTRTWQNKISILRVRR